MQTEFIIAVLGGLTILITAICTGMHNPRCKTIDCGCIHIERDPIADEGDTPQVRTM